jgi:transketolase
MDRIAKLLAYGQSCWMDDSTRRMIESVDLACRVADGGLRGGITSNPTIFAKAVARSSDYGTSRGRPEATE